jgi:hypothetical protein
VRTALVTLTIGDDYKSLWSDIALPTWRAYCDRHDYSLVAISHPLDVSSRARSRSPAWQKCLVLEAPELQTFDRVVWVDADIIINPNAPPITDGVPVEKIGAVDESRFPTREANVALNRAMISSVEKTNPSLAAHLRRSEHPPFWHQDGGTPLNEPLDAVVQTGVMVLSRRLHAGVLRHVYEHYEDKGAAMYLYEMRPLSYEIQTRGLSYWIDCRFNASVSWMIGQDSLGRTRLPTKAERVAIVQQFFRKSYFIHFCGHQKLMRPISAAMLSGA